ncbi:MAG: hypothetical protein LBU00_04670, partial [Treponema sp.]|nr:hypothetical protein [Treponema sp.]
MIRQGGAPRFPIKLALITGTLLAALTTAALIFLSLRPDRDYLPVPQDPFHRLLREYDLVADSPPDPAQLDAQISLLDRMERSAQGVESWLSLLKRRRALAGTSLRMLLLYQASSRRAAAVFPWSEPLAAVAAAALLQGTAPGATAEAAASAEDTDAHRTAQSAAQAANRAELRAYAALIKETSLCPLALGVSILIGDLASPDRLPAQEALLSAALPLVRPGMPRDQGDRLIANLAILRLLKGDYRGAEAQILGIARSENPELRNFLGEYYYDFGDPLQAAVMFNRVGDERALIRSADALWLGGKTESAGTIWRALNGQSGTNPVEPALRLRSLYNLAAGAPDTAERNKWLSLLIAGGQENPGLAWEPAYLYGLTAYTRTLDPYEALALLDIPETGPEPAMAALRDLEILRRRGELWPLDRTLAETWLLLGRYPQDSRLYQWAAWYFSHQRR